MSLPLASRASAERGPQQDSTQDTITPAAFQGLQMGGLDSTAAQQREDQRNTQATTPADTSSSIDEKAASPTENVAADGTAPGNGHWLQKNEIVLPHNNMYIVMPGLMLVIFLAALDQTIVSTALPAISEKLSGDAGQYSWVGSAYLLSATALIPLYGRLSDLTGRKPLLYAAILIFLCGSALCGAAQNMAWLDAARGVQGIGGGGIVSLVNIIIGDIVSLEKRGKYSGWVGACWGVASVLGPLLGGALTQAGNSGWRWCFFINLPTGGIAFGLLFFGLNLNARPKLTFREACGEFDFVGLIMVIVAVVLVLLGFNSAETKAWNRPDTIALLTVGGCLLIAFMVWEFHTTRKPIVPPRLVKTRTTALLLLSVVMHSMPFFASTYYLPVYFQAIFGASPLMSGVYMLPYALVASITSSISGVGITKFRAYRPFLWIGWSIMLIGHGLMATLNADSSQVKQEFYIGIAGFGTGFLFQTPMVGLMAAMPHGDLSTTVATMSLLRSLGGTMGIAIAGAIFNTQSRQRLGQIPGFSESLVSTSSGGQDLTRLRGIQPPELSSGIIHAYADGLQVLWIVLAPLVAVGFLATLGVKGYSLKRNIKQSPDARKNKDVENATSTAPTPADDMTPTTTTSREKDHS